MQLLAKAFIQTVQIVIKNPKMGLHIWLICNNS